MRHLGLLLFYCLLSSLPGNTFATETESEPTTNSAIETSPSRDTAAVDDLEPTASTESMPPAAGLIDPGPTLPKAKNVDLGEPVVPTEPEIPVISEETVPEPEQATTTAPFVLLNTAVEPGTATRLLWSPSKSYEGITAPTPTLIVNGAKTGPTLCLTAAIHGDELNGIEIIRRVLYNLNAEKLSGTVIGVPIVNLQGFRRGSRYLSDRRDLNRFFPGNTTGSSAARIAYSFFHEIISHCDALVDLHTGSFHRTNLPQLRADLSNESVVKLTQGFGATVILHSEGAIGTLRGAAVAAGIPAVTLEAGEPMRLDDDAVAHGVKGIRTLLNQMGMLKKISLWGEPEPVYHNSIWVRADQGGILFNQVELGERVNEGNLLGTVTDPITNIRSDIIAPSDGRIIGMALNQVVMPGFAAFHIAIQTEDQALPEIPSVTTPTTEEDMPVSDEPAGSLLDDEDLDIN